MNQQKSVYQIVVSPGILNDGTFGIYFVPEDNQDIEYQLYSQFKSEKEAYEKAKQFLTEYEGSDISDKIIVRPNRDIHIDSASAHMSEDDIKEALKNYWDRLFAPAKKIKIKKSIGTSKSSPYLLCIVVMIIFWFSLSLTIPDDFPIIGAFLGGTTIDAAALANLFPISLLILVLYVYLSARKICLEYSNAKDQIIILVTKFKWTLTDFGRFFQSFMAKGELGWLNKLVENWWRNDPDTVRKISIDASQIGVSNDFENIKEEVIKEDFENKIHAFYYLNKERDFKPSRMAIEPSVYLLNLRYAKECLRLRLSALSKVAIVPQRLSEKTVEKITKWTFGISLANVVLMLGALTWSIFISNYGFPFILCVNILVGISAMFWAPIWNYQVLIKNRGVPRGRSILDASSSRAIQLL